MARIRKINSACSSSTRNETVRIRRILCMKQPERYTCTRFWTSVFYHKKKALGPLISTLVYFQIYIRIRQDIRIRRSFRVLSVYGEHIFFVMLEQYQKLFLYGYRYNSSPSMHFLKCCPFKSCEEKSSFRIFKFFLAAVAEYAERNLTYADIMWNEI
jgi:hypothetical protein